DAQELSERTAELDEAMDELEPARRGLTREREAAATLRAALAEAEQARAQETERPHRNTAEAAGRNRHEAQARHPAETALHRTQGRLTALTADRDAARVRLADLEKRLQEERDTRVRAEGERDSARQQAEAAHEAVVELRTRLTTTEELQADL